MFTLNFNRLKLILLAFFILIIVGGGVYSLNNITKDNKIDSEIFKYYNLHSGDAKFLNNNIVTSVDGKLTLFDLSSLERKNFNIQSSWLSCLDEDYIVVYSNSNFETGICKFDRDYNIIFNNIILKTDSLAIDPSIEKVNDEYMITITLIDGIVNNGDINSENGQYTVKLYKSNDLYNWEFTANIISYKNNIEDVDLKFIDNNLFLVFEKEIIDKGQSSINIIQSRDNGYTWNSEIELINDESDNEPATFIKSDNNYYLYYSSDKDNIGQSYNASKIYEAVFDEKFNLITQGKEFDTINRNGNLLYDVKHENKNLLFLFCQNYLTDSNLIVESIKID